MCCTFFNRPWAVACLSPFEGQMHMILFLDIYKPSLEQGNKLTEQNLIDIVSVYYLD